MTPEAGRGLEANVLDRSDAETDLVGRTPECRRKKEELEIASESDPSGPSAREIGNATQQYDLRFGNRGGANP
jgi:hypothetical protein